MCPMHVECIPGCVGLDEKGCKTCACGPRKNMCFEQYLFEKVVNFVHVDHVEQYLYKDCKTCACGPRKNMCFDKKVI